MINLEPEQVTDRMKTGLAAERFVAIKNLEPGRGLDKPEVALIVQQVR